jgi:hypothetical protein
MITGMPTTTRWLLAALVGCGQADGPGGPSTVDVQFSSRGVTLAGTIHLPAGATHVPGVVLVHGSGPVTRDGNGPLIAPFLRQGIAVLAYQAASIAAWGLSTAIA